MPSYKHHIFVCASFRASGEPQGICHKKGSIDLLQAVEEGLMDRDMDDVMVSMCGCLKVCDRGPAMVVYPEGHWYGGIDEDAIEDILDALENGETADEYLLN